METWKIIPSYPYYSASSLGRIKRNAGTPRCSKDRVLKPLNNPRGYFVVGLLRPETKQRPLMIHRLVLEAFCGEAPTDKHQGNPLTALRQTTALKTLSGLRKLKTLSTLTILACMGITLAKTLVVLN